MISSSVSEEVSRVMMTLGQKQPEDLARFLELSLSVVQNWMYKGVSDEGLLLLLQKHKIKPEWIKNHTGFPRVLDDDALHPRLPLCRGQGIHKQIRRILALFPRMSRRRILLSVNVNSSTFIYATRYKRMPVPFLLKLFNQYGISPAWILYGEQPAFYDDHSSTFFKAQGLTFPKGDLS